MSGISRRSNSGRIALVMAFITLWTGLICARLGQLQILRHQELADAARERLQITRTVQAPRGLIYDSQMDELATSVTVNTVVAEPKNIQDLRKAARSLAAILELEPRTLEKRLADPAKKSFVVVKRRIDPKAALQIQDLQLRGVYFLEESMRAYPNGQLASHVLGFVNLEGEPGAGLELQYDRTLRGAQGEMSFTVDARRRSFDGRVEKPPVQGHSLVLSLNKSIQYTVERELAAVMEAYRASSGTVIVMESDTGRILAMANHPTFDANSFNLAPAEYHKNRAVIDMFEPGSTFKVVVAAAALEEGLTHAHEVIDCQMGSIRIGGHSFRDHKPYGLLTYNQVLEFSSNVGAAKLGLRLGERRLYESLRRFGFGSKTGVDLPGEIVGLVRDWQKWSALSIGAISFGQEVGVTPMQMLVAANAVANGGYRVTPSVVDRIIDQEGDLVFSRSSEVTRIMRPETAATVRDAFEGVVIRGTGRRAALEGYRAAGKTGTAQKIVDGRYSKSKYLSSFIGFAPLPHPRITVLVQIDEPRGAIYGGEVAAPVFARIAQETLMKLKVAPDRIVAPPRAKPELAVAAEDFLPDATPLRPVPAEAWARFAARTEDNTITMPAGDTVIVPDFHGLAKRDVVERASVLGIRVQTSGSGAAVSQVPPAGTPVGPGEICYVSFARGENLPARLAPAPTPPKQQ